MSINDEDQVVDEDVIVINNEVEEESTETDPVDSEENEIEESDPATIQDEDEDDEEDRVVTIGDPEPEPEEEKEQKQEMPGWVKSLRKSDRQKTSEIKKLKRQLEEFTKPKEEVIELGEEPTLASCEYDENKFKSELLSFNQRKAQLEQLKEKQAKEAQVLQEARQKKQQAYVEKKQSHGFKNFGEAESLVENTLSLAQQEIIVQGAEDSALVVYALGMNPKLLDDFANTTNPVDFAFKIAKMEPKLKVTNRRAPKPETKVKAGKGSIKAGSLEKQLEQLREEAARSGDYTKVGAFKSKHNLR